MAHIANHGVLNRADAAVVNLGVAPALEQQGAGSAGP